MYAWVPFTMHTCPGTCAHAYDADRHTIDARLSHTPLDMNEL